MLAAACAAQPLGEVDVHFGPTDATTLDTLRLDLAVSGPYEELALRVGRPGLREAVFSASDLDLVRGADGVDRAFLTIPPEHTDRRQRWRATLAARYGDVWIEDAATLALRNSPPTVAVTLDPAAPDTGEPIRALVEVVEPDEDPVVVSFAWWVDGAPQPTTGAVLPANATRRGAQVRVQVTAFDGESYAAPALASTRIANRRPTPPQVRVGPGPIAGATLSCRVVAPATHLDDLPLTYRVAWSRDGAPYTGATGETWNPGDTLPSGVTRPDERWTCRVTAFDGLDESEPATDTITLQPWSGPRRVTTCEATGPEGPTEGMCAATRGPGWLPGELEFEDGRQIWTVPFDGRYRITAAGASGGSPRGEPAGGAGAVVRSTIALNAGDRITILVGHDGEADPGGRWAGGGGGTFLVRDGRPLIVAGGGGGASDLEAGCPGEAGRPGSHPREITGRWTCAVDDREVGHGGWAAWEATGAGGGGFFGDGTPGRDGGADAGLGFLNGARGGIGLPDDCGGAASGGFGGGGAGDPDGGACRWSGGGGGGGYTGGGGGLFGGGGGSFAQGENIEATAGLNHGPGWVVLDVE